MAGSSGLPRDPLSEGGLAGSSELPRSPRMLVFLAYKRTADKEAADRILSENDCDDSPDCIMTSTLERMHDILPESEASLREALKSLALKQAASSLSSLDGRPRSLTPPHHIRPVTASHQASQSAEEEDQALARVEEPPAGLIATLEVFRQQNDERRHRRYHQNPRMRGRVRPSSPPRAETHVPTHSKLPAELQRVPSPLLMAQEREDEEVSAYLHEDEMTLPQPRAERRAALARLEEHAQQHEEREDAEWAAARRAAHAPAHVLTPPSAWSRWLTPLAALDQRRHRSGEVLASDKPKPLGRWLTTRW